MSGAVLSKDLDLKDLKDEKEESALKKALRLGGTLFAVTAVTGLLLGFVEWGTRQAILQSQAQARAEALRHVLPEALNFDAVELTADAPEEITGVQRGLDKDGQTVGCCISVASKGYGGIVSFIVGITKEGTIRAINILSHSETPGLGAKSTEPEFYSQFENRGKLPLKVVKGAAEAADEIAAISGATITSNAITGGVNAAADYWNRNLKGK